MANPPIRTAPPMLSTSFCMNSVPSTRTDAPWLKKAPPPYDAELEKNLQARSLTDRAWIEPATCIPPPRLQVPGSLSRARLPSKRQPMNSESETSTSAPPPNNSASLISKTQSVARSRSDRSTFSAPPTLAKFSWNSSRLRLALLRTYIAPPTSAMLRDSRQSQKALGLGSLPCCLTEMRATAPPLSAVLPTPGPPFPDRKHLVA
mmetsp:Transcript_15566/g.36983  ORF Transcript_15566/g.36983 Transcript_15566/m.36983 type:complete len:205 (+) Transcript_15566:2257-2871(+)